MSATCEPAGRLQPQIGATSARLLIDQGRLPKAMLAVIDALRFQDSSVERMASLNSDEWSYLLPWCDGRQVTLMLPHFCPDALPLDIQHQIAQRRTNFELRLRRLQGQLADISRVLRALNLDFVILKGFTHAPDLTPDPIWRAQGDIDIWCRPDTAQDAYEALQKLGYRPSPTHSRRHLPPLLLPDAWQWNGNLAEIPISVELHHELWGDVFERIPIAGEQQMWDRREQRVFGDQHYSVLTKQDLVGFAALHLFLHLIHGDLPLQRAWEIAHFLHKQADDEIFWDKWRRWHSPELKRIEAVTFSIVESWFRCAAPPWLEDERSRLSNGIQLWLDQAVFAPLYSSVDSNKNHLWLQLAFLPTLQAKCSAVLACFLPLGLPTFVDRIGERGTAGVLGSLLRQRSFLISRLRRHSQSVFPTLYGGLQLAARHVGFEKGFGSFLLASALFDVGEFLFVLLYSLYLLDRGFREDTLGLITGAMTAGTLVATPLAALAERRIGLRGLLIVASLGGGASTMLRAVVSGRLNLLLSAALNGAFFAFWAVAFAPVVAGLTRPRNRSVAFGMVTALGMSSGIAVGIIGVRLPHRIAQFSGFSDVTGKQIAIFIGSALVLLAAIPAMRLRIPHREYNSRKSYPRGPFLRRFTLALFLWIAATSSFNGFATAYLSLKLRLPLQQIGSVFSGGQALQVAAMLCGPLLIRRFGEHRYIFFTALGTAFMLLLLATGPPQLAIAVYLSYMTMQYMNEPSLFGLLMNRVSERQRTGASSIMFLAMSIAGTIAAPIAGHGIARYGYPVCLVIAAIIAVLAALLFRRLTVFVEI